MSQTAALRTAIEMGLFSHFPESGSVSLKDLTTKTGAESSLLGERFPDSAICESSHSPTVRILRVLCAVNVFTERGVNEYAATPMGKLLAEQRFQDLVILVYVMCSCVRRTNSLTSHHMIVLMTLFLSGINCPLYYRKAVTRILLIHSMHHSTRRSTHQTHTLRGLARTILK